VADVFPAETEKGLGSDETSSHDLIVTHAEKPLQPELINKTNDWRCFLQRGEEGQQKKRRAI